VTGKTTGNKSVATRIIESLPYQRGESFTVANMQARLMITRHQSSASIAHLLEQGKLHRFVKGNVTHYCKPQRHWIHTRRLANPVRVEA
jgi:Fic family protein